MNRLAVALLFVTAFAPSSLDAQVATSDPIAAYVRARAGSGDFTVPADEVPRGAASGGPLVIDVRSSELFSATRLAGSRSVPLQSLTAATLGAEAAGRRIIVVDAGDGSAIEAMVLLRLAGYDARWLRGDVARLLTPGASPEPSPPAPPIPGPPPPVQTPTPDFVLIGIVVAVITALLAVTVLIVQPWMRSRPLRRARALLQEAQPRFDEIETLLNNAVTAGLRKGEVADARFLLAYVRARSGRLADASTVLSDLMQSGETGRETAYLDLWLQVMQKHWDEAERSYERHASLQSGYLDAKRLAGIVYLEKGRLALLHRDIERGLGYFKRLRDLGEFVDEIPSDIEDHEMVLAVDGVIEGDFAAARERFKSVAARAPSGSKASFLARLGVVLCDWRTQEHPDLDQPLTAILDEALKDSKLASEALREHLLVWSVASLLYMWVRLPEKQGLPAAQRKELTRRLDRLRAVQAKSAEADLIEGLVDYYFAADDDARESALSRLRSARELGVGVPELLYLLECEERRDQIRANRRANYLILLRSYLNDPAVPRDLRLELHRHLNQFTELQPLEDVDVSGESVAQSVRDLQHTSELVERHVRDLLKGARDTGDSAAALGTLTEKMRTSRAVVDQATQELSRAQHEVMRIAGETLLPEEAAPEGA